MTDNGSREASGDGASVVELESSDSCTTLNTLHVTNSEFHVYLTTIKNSVCPHLPLSMQEGN